MTPVRSSTRCFAAGATLLSLLTAGCLRLAADPGYRGPEPLPAEIARHYQPPGVATAGQEQLLARHRDYTLSRILLPADGPGPAAPEAIDLRYYAPDRHDKVPVILVLPQFGGSTSVAESFAKHFARHGFAAILVQRRQLYQQLDTLDFVGPVLRQIVIDHRQVVDWIATRPELDTSAIGVFGFSMGGIKAALLIALEPRIRAGVIALAAGDLPYVLTYSDDPSISKRREQTLRKHGLDRDQLHQQLTESIAADPLKLAPYMDAGKVLLVLARFDRVVFYCKGAELRERMGGPETIYLLSGHYSAVIFKPYIQRAALEFFAERLGSADDRK